MKLERNDFEKARHLDMEKLLADNKTFLDEDLEDKKNACATYILCKREFVIRPGFLEQGDYKDTGISDLTLKNIKVTKEDEKYFLSIEFVGVHDVEFKREMVEIDDDYGQVLMTILEFERRIAMENNEDPEERHVFNEWVSLYQHIWNLNETVTPVTFRIYHANVVMEEKLHEPFTGPITLREAKKKYKAALRHVMALLNHKSEASSKIYVDPRVTAQWCRQNGLEMEAFLRAKHVKWAVEEVQESENPYEFLKPPPLISVQ